MTIITFSQQQPHKWIEHRISMFGLNFRGVRIDSRGVELIITCLVYQK
jgi:hypothetical protein